MLRIGTFIMGAEDLDRALAFWSQALGYVAKVDPGAEDDFTFLLPPSGEGARVALLPQHGTRPGAAPGAPGPLRGETPPIRQQRSSVSSALVRHAWTGTTIPTMPTT